MAQQVLVVGAGITGLTAAYRAVCAGKKVLLISDQAPGGAIRSSQIDGFTIEHGAAILVELPELAELIDQLGLRQHVIYPSTRDFAQGIWYNGAPRHVPRSLGALLRSPLLSPWHRLTLPLRVLLGALKLPVAKDISIADVAKKFLGQRGVDFMLTPALRAAYGQSAAEISARVMLRNALAGGESVKCLSLLKARRRRRGFMLRGGNQTLISNMLRRFEDLGGEFRIGKICELKKQARGFVATTESGDTIEADKIILTAAAELSGKISPTCPVEPPQTAIPLAIVHYAIDASALRARTQRQKKPLLGVLFPQGEVFGAMFPSQLFNHLAPAGQQLAAVYVGGAAWRERGIPAQSTIEQMAAQGLEEILPKCSARHLSTTIWERAIPCYPVGADRYDSQIKQLENSIPDFYAPLRERGGPGVGDRVAAASKIGV